MTFREHIVIENWFNHLTVDEEKYSELYSVYERMNDDGKPYETIAMTLKEMLDEKS